MEHAEALMARLRLGLRDLHSDARLRRGGHYSDLHNVSIVLLRQAMHRVRKGTTIQEEVEEKTEKDLVWVCESLIIEAPYADLAELNAEELTPYKTCILVHDVIAQWLVPISSRSLLRCTVSIIKQFCRSATQTCHDLARRGAYTEAALMLRSCGADPFGTPLRGNWLPLWQYLCSQSSACLHDAMEAAIMRSVHTVPKIVCDWVAGYNNEEIVFPPENTHAVVYALETIPREVMAMRAHGTAAVLLREIQALLRMETLPFIDANTQRRERALEMCAKAESCLNKLLAPRAIAFAVGMHPRLGA